MDRPINIEAERRYAEVAHKIIDLLETLKVKDEDILPTMAQAACSMIHGLAEDNPHFCSHSQVCYFMDMLLWYHKAQIMIERDNTHKGHSGADFMSELRRKGPSGPIDL